jgi:hypothetical protein
MSECSLVDLALHIDFLLTQPGNMAVARGLVESYLAGPVQGTVEPFPFPTNPDELPYESTDGDAVPTPAQRAAALAAFHDVHCPGVEKVIVVSAQLPELTLADSPTPGEALPPGAEALTRDWRRAASWRAMLDRVRGLGEHALPWFALQLRCFEQELAPNGPPGGQAADVPPLPLARHSLDFRSVHWFGADYTFTETQAAVVAILWGEWANGTPDVGHRTLLARARADSDDLHDLFKVKKKPHPAWGTMIRSNVGTKGTARLCPPDAAPSRPVRENPGKTPPCRPGGPGRDVR